MNETRRKPLGTRPYTLSHSTGSFICLVAQTRLDIPRLWFTQSHRHGWTYQGLDLPSHTDMAGHTKAFDYPVTQTRLAIPRPLITQSHRHGWTYQGLWLPSHTDTAGHTKAFDYPVTQTRLDIPRPWFTQSHRHGWTYQGLWLPSHTDTAGHTKALIYPVTQTRLDIPRPLITQSQTRLDIPRPWFTQPHRHGWTYQGLDLPSHTDTAGHTKALIYPVMDHWRKVKVLWHEADSTRRPVAPQPNTPTTRPRWPPQVGGSIIPRVLNGDGGLLPTGGGRFKLTMSLTTLVNNRLDVGVQGGDS